MHSQNLRKYVFSKVKNSPEFIPLLVYLHPPPTHSLTSSQADYWIQSLVDYYPEAMKDDVLKALAVDPDRIVPLIPYFLSNISTPTIILESHIKGTTAAPHTNHEFPDITPGPGVGIDHVHPPSSLTASPFVRSDILPDGNPFVENGLQLPPIPDRAPRVEDAPDSASPLSEDTRFYATPSPLSEREELPEEAVVYCGVGNISPLRPFSPFGRSEQRLDTPDPSFGGSIIMGLWAEIGEIQNAVVFRVDREVYQLSVPKAFVLSGAYRFVLGAFSFLGLRTLSYSPLAALICSFPLALVLILVAGVLIWPEGSR
ncbi:hypothetical protein BDM02DRAFT_3192600 [Thelephora ganbajun]|uniref:Uncharacterized protein n=1 Tax=Thelephora ganbajun TaxID=370292 RepID=A0ACB6YZV4_THEGA|nr:hypothetical protein BDM02DRAFT_3192600 [Thelephora ganbajun]